MSYGGPSPERSDRGPETQRESATGSGAVGDDIPAWARNRWVTEDVEPEPTNALARWSRNSNEAHRERTERGFRFWLWFGVGAAVGAGLGSLVGEPGVVAGALALPSAVVMPFVVDLIRTGRR